MTTVAVSGGYPKTQQRAVVSLTSSGTVVAAVTGKAIKVTAYSIQSRTVGMTCQFTDGNGGTNLSHVWSLDAREGVISGNSVPTTYHFATSTATALFAVLTGTGTVDIDVSFWADGDSV